MIEKRQILARLFPPEGLCVPLKYVPIWPAIDKAIDNLVAAMNGEECDCGGKCGHVLTDLPDGPFLCKDVQAVSTNPLKEVCAPPEPKLDLTGEPDKPSGITATDAPNESPPAPKIPREEDEVIYVMRRVERKTFSDIAKALNKVGIDCSSTDVSNRYYKTQDKISKKRGDDLKASLPTLPPAQELSKLPIEDARILKMANEGCTVHEICVYVNRNFYGNYYSTTQMAEKIRNLQARVQQV